MYLLGQLEHGKYAPAEFEEIIDNEVHSDRSSACDLSTEESESDEDDAGMYNRQNGNEETEGEEHLQFANENGNQDNAVPGADEEWPGIARLVSFSNADNPQHNACF